MSALKKATILASVATSPLAKRRMLRDLGCSQEHLLSVVETTTTSPGP